MARKGDRAKRNQPPFSKANTPAGKLSSDRISSVVCSVGKVGMHACAHACLCVCVPTAPVAIVSSVPHAAHFMCLPLAKTKH